MAAKDEAAIIAATAKLNTDLKVLGTLGAQNLKLLDIKSLLESLKPKDLINLSNLEDALALLGKINLAATGSTKAPTGVAASGIPVGDFISPISTTGGSISSILEYADAASARANAFADLLDAQNILDAEAFNASPLGNAAGNNISITVNTGVGDPNAIAEAIDEVLRNAVSRGTLTGGVFAV
jgi:PPE-repeat protein